MLYRLFIYATTAFTSDASAIAIVDRALKANKRTEWEYSHAYDYMEDFECNAVRTQIEKELRDKCVVVVHHTSVEHKNKPYLFIGTSYAKVREVLPRLYAIALENELVLFDGELNKGYYKQIIDDTFVKFKEREKAIRIGLRENLKAMYACQKLYSNEEGRDKSCAYVVTIKKLRGVSFEESVELFYKCLEESIVENEKLDCVDKTFRISGEWYTISFCLEGYRKNPDRIGYMENGRPKTELLHRMGCIAAFKWMKKECDDIEAEDIVKRINFNEMKDRYKNPADRFVKSVLITKRLRKELFDIRYSGFGYYGSEILFHVLPDEYFKDDDAISVLKIEEESASFLLPFITEIYPYFLDRYYLTDNHIPPEMWEDIVKKIKYAKTLILSGNYGRELDQYIDRFNLFVLGDSDDRDRIKKQPKVYLYEHRYDVAHLYDIFIEWSEIQLKLYGKNSINNRLFNIQGP